MTRSMRLVLPLVLWAISAQAAPSAGLSVSHADQLGDLFQFSYASVVVDGRPFAARDRLTSGSPVIQGALEPGTHAIAVEFAYVGRSGVFSYINGYRFRFRARLLVQLGPGDLLRVTSTARLRDVTQRWEDRAELLLTATPERAVLKKEVLPVIRDPMLPDGGFPSSEPILSSDQEANAQRQADQAIADLMKQAGPEPQARVADAEPQKDAAGGQVASASAKVSARSCPLPTTHFAFAQAAIDRQDAAALVRTAACLAVVPDARLRVEGHCDPIGGNAYNVALGERRARAVAQFLTAHGVDEGRLRVTSYGKAQPVCRGTSASCRAQDRRVELVQLPAAEPEGRALRGGGTSRPSSAPRSARAPRPCTPATRTTDTPPGGRW